MSGESSRVAGWSGRLAPVSPREGLAPRPDDPRLGEFVSTWRGDLADLLPGRPVLIGFPQDEGVRRNQGRPGAALAPAQIRRWLYRLTPFRVCPECGPPLRGGFRNPPRSGGPHCFPGQTVNPEHDADLTALDLLDLGDLQVDADLEASQMLLGQVVGAVLRAGAVPIVLGGGHETAYGHYLGYLEAGLPPAVVNIDAHLDVRPLIDGKGHSGSPFRQMLEHPGQPLPGQRYACLGVQPFCTSAQHAGHVRQRGGQIHWGNQVEGRLGAAFGAISEHLKGQGCRLYVSLDADVVQAGDVPGVSAPAPVGLSGNEVAQVAFQAGASPAVASFDLVEINPLFDLDNRSARWAAVVIWNFLTGLAARSE